MSLLVVLMTNRRMKALVVIQMSILCSTPTDLIDRVTVHILYCQAHVYCSAERRHTSKFYLLCVADCELSVAVMAKLYLQRSLSPIFLLEPLSAHCTLLRCRMRNWST